ncbi:hypothetical protein ACN38_g4827 [Penicillium nordicum]|uniref:Uncharacterized protein n=1 Tax=Penicillium nordicum TaxID=229535 RepID=A0A0M8PAU3_9EURO|nr:hypothetical protein ACN38_g4827 [Penicillium nordicum]
MLTTPYTGNERVDFGWTTHRGFLGLLAPRGGAHCFFFFLGQGLDLFVFFFFSSLTFFLLPFLLFYEFKPKNSIYISLSRIAMCDVWSGRKLVLAPALTCISPSSTEYWSNKGTQNICFGEGYECHSPYLAFMSCPTGSV